MATTSGQASESGGEAAFTRPEAAVDRLLGQLEESRAGAGADAVELARRVRTLEGENADLRERLTGGREIAERLTAKIRFLEEKK